MRRRRDNRTLLTFCWLLASQCVASRIESLDVGTDAISLTVAGATGQLVRTERTPDVHERFQLNGGYELLPSGTGTLVRARGTNTTQFFRVEESAAVFERLGAVVDLRRYPGLPHSINADELQRLDELLRGLIS